jgi:hypothetical protein
MRCVRRLLVGIACLVALLCARPADAAQIGISDQDPHTFSHPLFEWSGIRTARVIAPWDAGLRASPDLAWWLEAVRVRGIEPLVTFGNRRGEDCRVVRCYLPSGGEMRTAMRAFRARWPWVTTFSTWNEANHPGQPTARRPGTAADLYEAIVAECPGCTVVAIEVLDIDGMDDWLDDFRRSLPVSPQLWGLQNYGDVTHNRTVMTDRMMKSVPGQVWVTETGGIVSHVQADGVVRWGHDEERARASVARALALADRHPGRIGRVYFYEWMAPWGGLWDSGLMRPDGTPRPSFNVLAARLRPGVPVPPVQPVGGGGGGGGGGASGGSGGSGDRGRTVATGPGGTVHVGPAGAGGAPTLVFVDTAGVEVLRLVGRPRLGRRGVVRATVACPRARAGGCPARMTVRTRARGRSRAGRLLARTRRTIGAGTRRTLAVRLERRDRRLIQRRKLRILVVHISVPDGPRWRVALKARR